MERVLIVDDDPDIVRLVSYNLTQAGFDVATASTGRQALETVQNRPPDLIILDLMLPDVDGIEVCRNLRSQDVSIQIPIIMLTARSEEIDRVIGFQLGADDYVMKPFSPRELVLRVKSILKRTRSDQTEMLRVARIQLFPERRQCFVGSEVISLTVKEFDLLYELMRGRGNVLSREFLMDRVWGYHGDATSRTLDTHVRRLREKLGEDGACVETVRGVGYRIALPVEKR
jgi:two-component system, OmpR family, phosphate regulon response regulator PhoB